MNNEITIKQLKQMEENRDASLLSEGMISEELARIKISDETMRKLVEVANEILEGNIYINCNQQLFDKNDKHILDFSQFGFLDVNFQNKLFNKLKEYGAYLIHSGLIIEDDYPCWDVLTPSEFEREDFSDCSYTYITHYKQYMDCDTYLTNNSQREKLYYILGVER